MKGLKKLALVTAVAAAPFAQAEMTAMDDALLGEMTGQAGITIDVDLQMTIDAIKYVDDDGATRPALDLNGDGDTLDAGENAIAGTQGAITLKSLSIGSIDEVSGALSAAQIRGVTIDADGSQGLSIGFGKIGDTAGNGIDITVDAVLINNGKANLAASQAVQAVQNNYVGAMSAANATTVAGNGIYTLDDYKNGTVAGDLTPIVLGQATQIGAYAATLTDAQAEAIGFDDAAQMLAVLGGAAGATDQGKAAVAVAALAGQEQLGGSPSAEAAAISAEAAVNSAFAGSVSRELAQATGGNVGGFVVKNFRNYIQDTLVENYNGVFDMALQNSEGGLQSGATMGRYVRGELNIAGTGSLDSLNGNHTGGLAISGKFGGAIDKAAWVDGDGTGASNEFGVKDLGFFNGVDTVLTDGTAGEDGIADVIEGMHFSMNIDVVEMDSAIETGVRVSALQISDMKMEGTIMMGNIYLGGTNTSERSLGSVLIKDIDMTGTSVRIYGH